MSGHSKWSTIKRKKEKTDNARAKVFTKIGREISVAVKAGGPDPAANSKLKDVIAKAKAANVPNDNIERIIKKAAGEGNADNYENIVYEGYGPSGIAVIIEALTDNRNRTAADVRHAFDKFGGNMGTTGCVSFMFSRQGVILLPNRRAQGPCRWARCGFHRHRRRLRSPKRRLPARPPSTCLRQCLLFQSKSRPVG